MTRQNYLFTSESVSEGHPDKVCDRISDEIVDLVYREAAKKNGDGKAQMDAWDVRVACETLATTNRVVIAGEVRVPKSLLKQDTYLLLADFADYVATQARVDALFASPQAWYRSAALNVAGMGPFSSDRTIREYASRIWSVKPLSI